LLFDCGPATTYKLLKTGIAPKEIGHLFFTHHHYDHNADYPGFLLSRWDTGYGDVPQLKVFGPEYTEQLTSRLIDPESGAFAPDIRARTNHPVSVRGFQSRGGRLPRKPPTVNAQDVGPGPVCHGDGWEVVSAAAQHVQPWLESLAYRVDSEEGSIVFTGDAGPGADLIELARGADTLVSMCHMAQRDVRPEERDSNLGTITAGQVACKAGVERLVLVHHTRAIGAEYLGPPQPGQAERVVAEVATVFHGEIVLGREFLEIAL
jgi:ribonuclease BN (tRNA processing enzyme)